MEIMNNGDIPKTSTEDLMNQRDKLVEKKKNTKDAIAKMSLAFEIRKLNEQIAESLKTF